MDTLKRLPGRIKNLTDNEISTAVAAMDLSGLEKAADDEFQQIFLISSTANRAVGRLINTQGALAIIERINFTNRDTIRDFLGIAKTGFLRTNESIYASELAESNGDTHEDKSTDVPTTAVNGSNGAVHNVMENADLERLTQAVYAIIDTLGNVPLTSAILVHTCLTIFTREQCHDADMRMRVVDAVHLHYNCHFDVCLMDQILGQSPMKKVEKAPAPAPTAAEQAEPQIWDRQKFLELCASLPRLTELDDGENRTAHQMLKLIGEQSPRPFDSQHVQIICLNLGLEETRRVSVTRILHSHFGLKRMYGSFELPPVSEPEQVPPPAPRKIDQWEGQFLGPQTVQTPQEADQLMSIPKGVERRHAIPKIFDPAEVAEHIKRMAPLGSGADKFFAALYRYFGTTHFQKTTVLHDETEEGDEDDINPFNETNARPGSEEKLRVLEWRYAGGHFGTLFSDRDAQDHTPDTSVAFTKLANLARLAAEDEAAEAKGEPVKKRKGRRTAGKVA